MAFLSRARSLVREALGPESAPQLVGYRTLKVLSAGAQGIVYKAIQESTSRIVAIKTHAPGQPFSSRQRARAEREAEIAARLQHPNVVTIFESRILADGRVAVIMEFVDGVPMDQWKPPGANALQRQRALLKAFVAVANGVHHAHLNGVIHRDLKPANILVTGESRPVVVDFGVAKAGGIGATMTGEFAGTPAYASPEQTRGRPGEVNALTDVYSLGVILYQLLCEKLPYEMGDTVFDITRTINEVEPTPPRSLQPLISTDLEAIVLRALRKDKDRRYQSAAALSNDLERFLEGKPVEARSGSASYLLRRAVSVNRKLITSAAVAILVVAATVGTVWFTYSKAAQAAERESRLRDQSRVESVRARAVTELLRATMPNSPAERPNERTQVGIGLGRLHMRLETGAFSDEPELDQALRRLWGGVYSGFGSAYTSEMSEFAEVSLRTGLMQLRQNHASSHPDTASTMHQLASVLQYRRQYRESEDYVRMALKMRLELDGPESVPVAESRALLARILYHQQNHEPAAQEAHTALEALNKHPEESQGLLIASLNALLGRIALASGETGEQFLRVALVEQLKRLPPSDPELLGSLEDLAMLAEWFPTNPLVEEAASTWRALGPSVHEAIRRDVATLRLRDESRVQTGRTVAIGRLLPLQEALLGKDHLARVGVLLAQITSASYEELEDEKAKAALKAADILSERFGPNSFAVLACIEQAAIAKIFGGHPEEAIPLARRACEILDSVPLPARDSFYAANERRYLAWILTLAGRYEEAVPEWLATIEQVTSSAGPEHHVITISRAGLAFCLAELGRFEEADAKSLQAVKESEARASIAQDQISAVLMARGHVLTKMGRYAEARPILLHVWETWYQYLPQAYAWRRSLLADLALTCDALGDTENAAAWRDLLNQDPARR